MPPRPNKTCSAHTSPLCIPPQRPVLESLRLPGPVVLQLPRPCASRPRLRPPSTTPSSTYSYEEDYCKAETCYNSNSCIQSQPVEFCPFGKREDTECRGPCRICQARDNEEENCKGPCRKEAMPQTCKGLDASTDAAVRFYVDHNTSAQQIMPPRSLSMPCFSDMASEMRGVHDSSAQMSNEVPLCCRPGTDGLPCPLSGNSICKSASSTVTQAQSVATPTAAAGLRKPCCASDATFESGPRDQASVLPNRVSSIASGTFQKLAATPTCLNTKQDMKRKSERIKCVSTGSCSQAKCPANTAECPCRFPPAYNQFQCTGNIGGTCNCARNK